MNTFEGILLFAGLAAVIYYFVQKIIGTALNAVAKTANKNVPYRSEYKEVQALASESLSFETSASIDATAQGQFVILSWKENDGLVVGLDTMKKLRKYAQPSRQLTPR